MHKTLLGKQNSVTNAVYLLSAKQSKMTISGPEHLEFAFSLASGSECGRSRFRAFATRFGGSVDDKAALVRERVSI